MIRQAISCDVCATEKRQTNHWFVAYEQAGELRVSGWNSRYKLRQGAKHLCGQTCLHKLVDEYMAKSIASRSKRPKDETESENEAVLATGSSLASDTSLTSSSAYVEVESSARLIPSPKSPLSPDPASPLDLVRSATAKPSSVPRPQPELVKPELIKPELATLPPRPRPEDLAPIPDELPRFASRAWQAEAWERERERELRAQQNHRDNANCRRSGTHGVA